MIINKLKNILFNKELFWTFLYQFITLVGGVLLIKLLAVTLSKNDYGYYALVMSIVAFVVMVPFSALMQGVARYISIYKNKKKYNHFLKTVLFVNLVLLSIYILFSIIYINFFKLSLVWQDIYYLIVLFTISEIVKILFRTINNTNRERKNLSISIGIEFSLKIILLYSLSKFIIISISNVLVIFIIADIISIVIMLFKNKEILTLDTVNYKEMILFSIRVWIFAYPLIIWAVFGWLRDMSNRWYLDYFLDKESVALFAMMSSIAMIAPTALSGLISGFLMPILYQKDNHDKSYVGNFLLKLLPSIAIVLLISFVITYIFKNEIILIIADKKYLEISWMLPWMFLTFSIYALAMMSTYEIFAHKQTKRLIYSSVLPGIISMIFGYFLIKNFSIEGAMYNYILTYLSYSVLTFYVVFKYWKQNQLKRTIT